MDDLIRNLYYQASSYRPLENDLKNALQRAQTIRLASLLELLKEGNITSNEHLSPEQTREYASAPTTCCGHLLTIDRL